METINLRGISKTLSENEMKNVMGGEEWDEVVYDHEDEGGGRTVGPCPPPKRPCNGPTGTFVDGGICCLGPWGPNRWFGTFCYAVLTGLNRCP